MDCTIWREPQPQSLYRYPTVGADGHAALLGAESIGKHFHRVDGVLVHHAMDRREEWEDGRLAS